VKAMDEMDVARNALRELSHAFVRTKNNST